jgi:C_GCAxxG_C_C family probable redox protein
MTPQAQERFRQIARALVEAQEGSQAQALSGGREKVETDEDKEIDRDCDCIPRIAAGLAGGMGRQGEVCGACTGGVLLVGLAYGPDRPDDAAAKAAVQSKAGEFVQRFADLNGGIRCRDLTGMDLIGEEAVREYYALNLQEEVCNGIVSKAVRALLELRNGPED